MKANELQKTWEYFTNNAKKQQAKHLLKNCKYLIIHEVGKLKVFKMTNHFEIVNEESLVLKFFDTEVEAMDYCLDVYPETNINEQIKLF